MPRDKLPAPSVMQRLQRQAELDRAAIAAVTANGRGLSVPAFCVEMGRLLGGWDGRRLQGLHGGEVPHDQGVPIPASAVSKSVRTPRG